MKLMVSLTGNQFTMGNFSENKLYPVIEKIFAWGRYKYLVRDEDGILHYLGDFEVEEHMMYQ